MPSVCRNRFVPTNKTAFPRPVAVGIFGLVVLPWLGFRPVLAGAVSPSLTHDSLPFLQLHFSLCLLHPWQQSLPPQDYV
jgi:hypothetical protein